MIANCNKSPQQTQHETSLKKKQTKSSYKSCAPKQNQHEHGELSYVFFFRKEMKQTSNFFLGVLENKSGARKVF